MPKPKQLERTFHFIIEQMIATGQAPDYLEVAAELGVSVPDGRRVLRRLFGILGFPGWFYPKSETIVSFAPFSNLPTNYRLSIDGEQKWFAQ